MVDFTNMPVRKKTYAGANGSKISVRYQDEWYMLKFPALAEKNPRIEYANSCVSEYLGSHIFNLLGVPAQETLLGTYRTNKKVKIVVACKDFTGSQTVFADFASLKNSIIDSGHNGYGTELSEIIDTIESQKSIDVKDLSDFFWDMFIVDAFIANWDRHNGNWGFIYSPEADNLSIAPVFDCGSSLYAQADDNSMTNILSSQAEIDYRIFEMPTSSIRMNGKRIRYYDFISSLKYVGCNDALKRIVPRIDMQRIKELIDETPFLSKLQKEFYWKMLTERKEKILDRSLQLLKNREQAPEQETPVR